MEISNRKPSLELGERDFNCEFYNECLDEAAKKSWETFSCNDCPVYSGCAILDGDEDMNEDHTLEGMEKTGEKNEKSGPENTRRCECGNITLSAGCPYCPSCMAQKANEKRQLKKQVTDNPKEKTGHRRKEGVTGKRNKSSANAILVDFKEYEFLFDWLKQDSINQVRPIENQVIWILKNAYEKIERTVRAGNRSPNQ